MNVPCSIHGRVARGKFDRRRGLLCDAVSLLLRRRHRRLVDVLAVDHFATEHELVDKVRPGPWQTRDIQQRSEGCTCVSNVRYAAATRMIETGASTAREPLSRDPSALGAHSTRR